MYLRYTQIIHHKEGDKSRCDKIYKSSTESFAQFFSFILFYKIKSCFHIVGSSCIFKQSFCHILAIFLKRIIKRLTQALEHINKRLNRMLRTNFSLIDPLVKVPRLRELGYRVCPSTHFYICFTTASRRQMIRFPIDSNSLVHDSNISAATYPSINPKTILVYSSSPQPNSFHFLVDNSIVYLCANIFESCNWIFDYYSATGNVDNASSKQREYSPKDAAAIIIVCKRCSIVDIFVLNACYIHGHCQQLIQEQVQIGKMYIYLLLLYELSNLFFEGNNLKDQHRSCQYISFNRLIPPAIIYDILIIFQSSNLFLSTPPVCQPSRLSP